MRRLLALLSALALVAGCGFGDDSKPIAAPTTTGEASPPPPADGGGGGFGAIPEIVDRVQPSVVSVVTNAGQGSGVVYRRDGFVVTNNHVIAQAGSLAVVLLSGERLEAEVRAADPLTDLAVLEVDRGDLPAASFSEELPQVGELAVAMGNPLGFENSVTAGIVSGVNRSIPSGGSTPALVDLIQTDAPISPGNSGGGLFDAEGRVIGINVAFIPPQAQAVSLGFAIPASTVVSVADQLIETGRVEHAYLGIFFAPVTPQLNEAFQLGTDTGVLVRDVAPGGPAAQAGIEPGDVIVRFGDREIETAEDLLAALREHAPGDRVDVGVLREGEEQTLTLTLAPRPQN